MEEKEAILRQQSGKKEEKGDQFETDILEKLIVKIGALLLVGFGENGSKIVAASIGLDGQVNPFV